MCGSEITGAFDTQTQKRQGDPRPWNQGEQGVDKKVAGQSGLSLHGALADHTEHHRSDASPVQPHHRDREPGALQKSEDHAAGPPNRHKGVGGMEGEIEDHAPAQPVPGRPLRNGRGGARCAHLEFWPVPFLPPTMTWRSAQKSLPTPSSIDPSLSWRFLLLFTSVRLFGLV
jgi:hypothetical protein